MGLRSGSARTEDHCICFQDCHQYTDDQNDIDRQLEQKADQVNGENIKSRVEAISNLLEQTLSQQFVVTKFETTFNLSKLLFTAVNDPDLWFVVNY